MGDVKISIKDLPYESDIPDLNIDEVRRDFFDIWQKNIVVVEQWRPQEGEAGNYGSETDGNVWLVSKEIRLNIQGSGSDNYSRQQYGIDTTSKGWHAFALYTESLQNNDRIIWNGNRFIINNINQGTYAGQRVFWEFDLKSIDKDKDSFYNASL